MQKPLGPKILQSKAIRALELWGSIFDSNDPFSNPFSTFEKLVILYPTDGYYLDSHQFRAIQASTQNGYYALNCEYENLEVTASEIWLAERFDYTEYIGLSLYLENCLYSPDAEWGAIISHEDHAILGGKEQFVDCFIANYPNAQSDRDQFANNWPEASWAKKLLDLSEI